MPTTTITDRSAETPMPACATHTVELRLIVRGQLPEGIEAHHLLEYLQAYLGNREADLHEDIYDELDGLALECLGQEVSQKERQAKDEEIKALRGLFYAAEPIFKHAACFCHREFVCTRCKLLAEIKAMGICPECGDIGTVGDGAPCPTCKGRA